jgi:hypothetical protein
MAFNIPLSIPMLQFDCIHESLSVSISLKESGAAAAAAATAGATFSTTGGKVIPSKANGEIWSGLHLVTKESVLGPTFLVDAHKKIRILT